MATTWNPADKDAGITLSGGNLTATGSDGQNYRGVRATAAITTGQKRYWEVQFSAVGANDATSVGMANTLWLVSNYLGVGGGLNAESIGLFDHDLTIYGGGGTSVTTQWVLNDSVCFALDFDAALYWIRVNSGAWNAGAGDPATGAGGYTFGITGNIYPAVSLNSSAAANAKFTSVGLVGTIPTGFAVFDPPAPPPPTPPDDDDRARRALEHYRLGWLAQRRRMEDEDDAWLVLQR